MSCERQKRAKKKQEGMDVSKEFNLSNPNPCTRQILTGCPRSILQVPPENSLVNYQCYFLEATMQSQCNASLEAYGAECQKRNAVTKPETIGV